MPPEAGLTAVLTGALAGSAFIAEPNDQESAPNQPAFSTISRPLIEQL